MNSIHKINQINQKELVNNTPYKSSWHYDYRDTNYIYIGNIPQHLTYQDIIIIFSQYGIPTHLNLIVDKQTGKHRGFAFLKYSNFKSCILAVDNFNGIKIGDKNLRVDHNYYKLKSGENESDYLVSYEKAKEIPELIEGKHKEDLLDEELKDPIEKHLTEDDDELKDPMEEYLKQKESHKHKHRHRHRERHHTHRDKSPTR